MSYKDIQRCWEVWTGTLRIMVNGALLQQPVMDIRMLRKKKRKKENECSDYAYEMNSLWNSVAMQDNVFS